MPKQSRRRFTEGERKEIARHYSKHGHSATTEKFKISPSSLYASLKHTGISVHKKAQHKEKNVSMTTLILARKLRKAIVTHIAADNEINDVELTALLLVKELIGGK